MWWIIGLLWVIACVVVVAMCMCTKEPDCELYSSGYQNAMNLYFIHGVNINTLKAFIKYDIRHDQYCDDSRGLDDAIDVLESFGFPDTYDGEYLPL